MMKLYKIVENIGFVEATKEEIVKAAKENTVCGKCNGTGIVSIIVGVRQGIEVAEPCPVCCEGR